METSPIQLYGYQKEMQQITDAVADWDTLDFVCLHGKGGMGKTTLLRATYDHYRDNSAYCITQLLDFDDLKLHILYNILSQIANQVCTEQETFASYSKELADLRRLQRKDVNRMLVEEQEQQTLQAFVSDYTEMTKKRRAILLFDTVEKVQDLVLWKQLSGLLVRLKNTTVLLAGRRNDQVSEDLKNQPRSSGSVQTLHLQGLPEEEAIAYFKRTEVGATLAEKNLAQAYAVCQLSNGCPIFIDLAVDWLRRGKTLPGLDQPTDKLDDDTLQQLRNDFERGLVEPINDLSVPVHEVILELAHIYHYFSVEHYQFLHADVSGEELADRFAELNTFSFVKPQPGGGWRLHDEMRRMVICHVWSRQDRSGERRRSLSRRIVQFLEEKRAQFPEDSVMWQSLTAEQLYHRLYADLEQGHDAFEPIFRQAISQYQTDFARLLLKTLEEVLKEYADNFEITNPELSAWVSVHQGRLLRAEEQVRDAIELIKPAKAKLQERNVHRSMDTVCNALGYCYRLIGDWDKAIAAYEESLQYSRAERDARQIAETMNNIANVCRLSGDFGRATRYSLVSLYMRQRLGNKRDIGNSCYVRGMVCWETGNHAEAANYLRRARQLFEEVDYEDGVALVDRYEALMHLSIGDEPVSLQLLHKASALFELKGIGAEQAECLNLEARILINQIADVGETEEGFRRIEEQAQKALDLARRVRDNYKATEAHLTLCRVYYRWGRYHQRKNDMKQAAEYYGKAQRQYDDPGGNRMAQQFNYLSLSSVYEWTIADMNYQLQEWDSAFNHYMDECAVSARLKPSRLFRALNGLSMRLHSLPPNKDGSRELTRHYCDFVIRGWKERGLAGDFPDVIQECEYVKTFFGLVDPRHLTYLRQPGDDLLERGEWKRAAEAYQQLLTATHTYQPSEQIADAMNQSAWAYRQMGEFSQARRLCIQSILIREDMCEHGQAENSAPLASSNLVMGSIMWTTDNPMEAARRLRSAGSLYREAGDEIGQARVDRQFAFLYFRIGDNQQAMQHINQAVEIFRKHNVLADLADALNLQQRILAHCETEKSVNPFNDESVQIARRYGLHYVQAESWLNCGRIEFVAGNKLLKDKKPEQARQHYERAKEVYGIGRSIAERFNYLLILSVYESLAAEIAFTEGRYAEAFEYFVKDLDLGLRYERARMWRELDRIMGYMARLDEPTRRYYADYMIAEWRDRGLADSAPDVPRLFQLLKEYSEYV